MGAPTDLLANAERLISDAEYLQAGNRSRSAATLIVVALEQMGAFVEALTKETYPDAVVHMGIFGKSANAHARRQDALAAHVMNFAFGQFMFRVQLEAFIVANGKAPRDGEEFTTWLTGGSYDGALTTRQQQEQRECPDIAAGHLLLHVVRTNQLKELREYGLYENTGRSFPDGAVRQMIDLAARVREILSRSWVVPEPLQVAGINMPEGLVIK